MKFLTKSYDGVPAVQDGKKWRDIYDLAGSFHRAIVEVREYDENAEISEDQRKWLHCEAGPIRLIMTQYAWSFRDAKEYCKVEWGRKWFVVELTDENIDKTDGVFRWECRKVGCRKLIHPVDIVIAKAPYGYIRKCPHCGNVEIKPIAIKSIMDVSVTRTNLWFREMIEHFPRHPETNEQILFEPDKDWFKKKENKSGGVAG